MHLPTKRVRRFDKKVKRCYNEKNAACFCVVVRIFSLRFVIFWLNIRLCGYIFFKGENDKRKGDEVMKILIVDDEEMIRGVLREYVEFEGNQAFEAADGMEAVKLCRENDYDLLLMDVMMPHLDGFSAVKEIKKVKDIPVIMLSARSEEYDKLFAFELGVDDYVTKPFSPKEVMARVNAVTKRREQKSKGNEILKFEGLEVDMAGRNVYVDGVKAELTPKEYELLFYLVRNKGIALTREKLLYDVWGFDFYGDDRTVDTHIKMLRGNLKEYRKFIVTLRGLGYKFEA